MREQTLTDIIKRTMGSQAPDPSRGGFGVHNYDSKRYRDIYENPDKYAITTSQFAPGPGYESSGITMEGYSGGDDARFYVFKKKPDRLAELRAEQTRLAKIAEEQFKTQSADIRKQLRIVQKEKSAVSKLSEEYSNMLLQEAEARRKAQEDSQIAMRTGRANLARSGQRGSLQIQPAGSTPRTAGTQQFRRRAAQFGGGAPYKGLSSISSGMVNV